MIGRGYGQAVLLKGHPFRVPFCYRGYEMLSGDMITILGAGIGGLAASIALAQRGAQVRVIEQAAEIAEVGAGIQISPNGFVVLKALGLGDAVAQAATRGRAVRLRDFRKGAEVFHLPLTRADRPYYFIYRADLITLLLDAAKAAGVTFELGRTVTSVETGQGGATLVLADGTTETIGLLVGADGLHSKTRETLAPKSRPFFTGQVAWRATVPAKSELAPEAHVFMGPGRHLVRYPIKDGSLVNIVAVEERDNWASEGWNHRDDPAHLRRAFMDFCPEIRNLLDRVEETYLWGLHRHPLAKTWADGHAVLLGDAAHPTLPFLAQGANMALEDAWVLARCLDQGVEQPTALRQFEQTRRPRCARIVEAASRNAENYHLRPGPYRLAAHSALRLSARFAPHIASNRFEWLYGHDVTRS